MDVQYEFAFFAFVVEIYYPKFRSIERTLSDSCQVKVKWNNFIFNFVDFDFKLHLDLFKPFSLASDNPTAVFSGSSVIVTPSVKTLL